MACEHGDDSNTPANHVGRPAKAFRITQVAA